MKESGITEIRHATRADIDSIEQIYYKIHREEAEGRAKIGWIPEVYPVRRTAEDALTRNELFVAVLDGRVVASAILNQQQMDCYREVEFEYSAEDEDVMVMHTLTVDPDLQHRRIGRHFTEYYEEYALERGCHVLRIDTQTKNENARGMYRKLGFREAGVVLCVFNGIPDVQLIVLEKKLL